MDSTRFESLGFFARRIYLAKTPNHFTNIFIFTTSRKLQVVAKLCALFTLAACTASNEPQSEELIKTNPPTINGASEINMTVPSVRYTIVGECDPISKGIEYSINDRPWKELATGCTTLGAFTLPNVYTPKNAKVMVRAKTKLGITSACTAYLRLVLPPTAPSFQLVTAGNAVDEAPDTLNFTMSSLDGATSASTSFEVFVNTIGIIFGE